jgi:hypothetical protein
MNRRHCAITALLMMMGFCSAAARGEDVSPVPVVVTIPAGEYTTPTPAGIKPFIDSNVNNLLVDSDPTLQGKARENIVAAANPNGAAASPAFLAEFCKQLDAGFTPHLAPAAKASIRQRLNIAIVCARVSAVADNWTLQATTLTLLNDKSEAVVLWALRSAQPQIAAFLKVNQAVAVAPPLIKAIGPAVMKHPTGPIFDEGYQALNANYLVVIDDLMKLWEYRIKKYQGKTPPDDPSVDFRPMTTMSSAPMWTTVIMNNKNLQRRVMQDISDQLSVAQQWGDKSPAGNLRDQLVQVVSLGAGGCVVIGGHQKLAALAAAATPASKISPSTFPPGNKLKPLVDPIIKEISTAFPNIAPPPMVAGQGIPAVPGVQPAANQH